MKAVMIPTVHLNGSSPEHLKEDTRLILASLRTAFEVMCQNGPNARDYYVKGEDAFPTARREHEARLDHMRAVLTEYEQILDGIQEQVYARDARRAGR